MPSAPLSFAADIRPLFTDVDVEHMQNYGIDLSSHDDVKRHAASILSTVTGGTMPPPGEGRERWSAQMCETFRQWMEQGFPP